MTTTTPALWTDSGFMTSSLTTSDGVQTTTTSTFRGKPGFVQVGTQAGATPLPAQANTFDTSDNLTQSTSPNGVVTRHTYDEYSDLATTTTTASGPTSPTSGPVRARRRTRPGTSLAS